jgi:hypothetical protein
VVGIYGLPVNLVLKNYLVHNKEGVLKKYLWKTIIEVPRISNAI